MNEPANLMALRTLKKRMRAKNVGLSKFEGIAKGTIDMRLGGKMKDGVNLVIMEDQTDKLEIENVAFDEFEIPTLERRTEILKIGTIVQHIEADEKYIGILLGHKVADMGADETRAAGDQDALGDVVGLLGHLWSYKLF
jgi:hypothetical protein